MTTSRRTGNNEAASPPSPPAVAPCREPQSCAAHQRNAAPPALGTPWRDLATRADVQRLVAEFCTCVAEDGLLAPVFAAMGTPLLGHVEAVTDFWCRKLLGELLPSRDLLEVHQQVHAAHPINPCHFAHWLALWQDSVDAAFAGPAADRAKALAVNIAHSMGSRLPGCLPGTAPWD
ncbi:group III truncated hemoglobin [Streptomyces yunnanensis]|uniref:Truncated hemoglobin YjbI n=1 Tax=Streptomyces yunnanensis TaxID=156453 RepID=A0A9X8QQM3_9ACTN|nr:group III truncated hemoglobin [Streptomyces yunnanensis]SHL38563.1 Truncated hemoglobin YjbI [Streptomyces yunnanensis]